MSSAPAKLPCPTVSVARITPFISINCSSATSSSKAPGVGAADTRFRGHNRNQFKRFSAIPNILYTDGNEWVLYRDGKQVRSCRLSGDVAADGKKAAVPQDARDVEDLLRDFFSWNPSIPVNRNGKIDLNRFAELLAPLCRMLRDDVMDALKDPNSPLVQLAQDWRQLLFPDAFRRAIRRRVRPDRDLCLAARPQRRSRSAHSR